MRSRTLRRNALCALVFLAGLAAAGAAIAQGPVEPATIKGRIFDDENGESMPYTNVFISGTNIGTMALPDGFYILRGLAPGT